MKRHRLQRIADAVLAHAQTLAWALLALGVAAFLLLPFAAKRCYLDEKALLVGGAMPTVRQSGTLGACLAAYQRALPVAGSGLAGLVSAAAGAVADSLPTAGPALAFHHHNFSTATKGGGRQCSTLHTVVRPPRGDGSEGFVLLLPINATAGSDGAAAGSAAAALAVAVGVASAAHLRQAGWLAKDAVVVFVDTSCASSILGAQAWMDEYNSGRELFAFPRAGLLQQALILQLTAAPGGASSAASSAAAPSGASSAAAELSVHGSDGQLPNLDLYYLVKRNLDMHTAFPVGLRASSAPLPPWAQRAAAVLGATASAAGIARPAAAQQYASELSTLAAFSTQLGSGQPTGPHAPFLRQHIDAATLTLRISGVGPRRSSAAQPLSPQLQVGAAGVLAAAELVLRTFNNLQERLHHSTALYVLLSPDRFASISIYLAPPACLLLAALAQLVAASRAAAGAPLQAWHAAWRRVAAAHVAAHAVTTLHTQALAEGAQPATDGVPQSSQLSSASWAAQLAWAALAGLAAAEGPAALLAAIWGVGPSSSLGSNSGRADHSTGSARGEAAGVSAAGQAGAAAVQRCTAAVALGGAVLQACHLLMGQWPRCLAFLLTVLPLHALAIQPSRSAAARLARRAALLAGGCAAAGRLGSSGAAWLPRLLLPYLLLALL